MNIPVIINSYSYNIDEMNRYEILRFTSKGIKCFYYKYLREVDLMKVV